MTHGISTAEQDSLEFRGQDKPAGRCGKLTAEGPSPLSGVKFGKCSHKYHKSAVVLGNHSALTHGNGVCASGSEVAASVCSIAMACSA